MGEFCHTPFTVRGRVKVSFTVKVGDRDKFRFRVGIGMENNVISSLFSVHADGK